MLRWHLPLHLPTIHRPKGELMHLFLSGVARRVAMTLLAIFSPIYVFRLGLELYASQKAALLAVVAFYFVVFIFKLIAMLVSEEVSRRIGFISTIKLSAIPFVLFILSLVFASYEPLFMLFSAAVFWGTHIGIYWWGYHGYFVKVGEIQNLGKELGEASFLETIAAIATPILGAYLVKYIGFGTLFVVSTLFIFLSMKFLSSPQDQRQKKDASFKNVIKLLIKKKQSSLSYVGFSVQSTLHIVFWPVFLIFIFGDVLDLGFVVSVSTLIASVAAMIMGDWVDKQGERKAMVYGVPMVFISWIVRTVNPTFINFVLANSLWNLGEQVVAIPLNSLSYKKAMDEHGTAQGLLFRETALTIGSYVALIMLGVFIIADLSFAILFMLVAFVSLASLLIIKSKDNTNYENK